MTSEIVDFFLLSLLLEQNVRYTYTNDEDFQSSKAIQLLFISSILCQIGGCSLNFSKKLEMKINRYIPKLF